MSWSAFILAAAVALTMDASFMPVFEFAGVTPSLVGCLAAFVALHAERRAAWWGCWALGVLLVREWRDIQALRARRASKASK